MSSEDGVSKIQNGPRVVCLGRAENDELFAKVRIHGIRGEQSKVLRTIDINDKSKELFDWLANEGCIVIGRRRSKIAEELARQVETESDSGRPIGQVMTTRGWSENGDFVTRYGVHTVSSVPLIAGTLSFADGTHLTGVSREALRTYYNYVGTGNPLVMFLVMARFAAPLLHLLDAPHQPWFVLGGPSTAGKTTLLRVAATVWGGEFRGALGNLSSLSGTINGLEDECAKSRDVFFTFDDVRAIVKTNRSRSHDERLGSSYQ